MAKLINKHFRVTENQDTKLRSLAAKTGYNSNELIRLLIDGADASTLSIAADERMKAIATNKWLATLYSNVSNNVNQLARFGNWCKVNNKVPDADTLQQAIAGLTASVDKLTEEVKHVERH